MRGEEREIGMAGVGGEEVEKEGEGRKKEIEVFGVSLHIGLKNNIQL